MRLPDVPPATQLKEPGGKSGSPASSPGVFCVLFSETEVKFSLFLSPLLSLFLWCFWGDVWLIPNCLEERGKKSLQLSGFGALTAELLASRDY